MNWMKDRHRIRVAKSKQLTGPPLKIEKSSILFAICIDFCGERLQGLGVVSAEILQFYFGEKG